jgi:hypothetical protein
VRRSDDPSALSLLPVHLKLTALKAGTAGKDRGQKSRSVLPLGLGVLQRDARQLDA